MTERMEEAEDTGIKLGKGHIHYSRLNDRELFFYKQLGLDYVQGWVSEGASTYRDIVAFRDKVEAAGLTLCHVGHWELFNCKEIVLGLPERDEKIRQLQSFIGDLNRADIHLTTIAWGGGFGNLKLNWRTETRGCDTRDFDMREAEKLPLVHGREYTEEELWENFAFFLEKILPVAEDAGVRIAMHPCDPPVPMCGVPRIFQSTDSFKRGMEIAGHSPNMGILFCVGTWGEMAGPEGKGEDIPEAIRHFGNSGRIFEVHFRNVSSPMPRFHETFLDNGYLDMYRVLEALRDVDFDGLLIPDHIPVMENEKSSAGHGAGIAYSIGYIRALLKSLENRR
jgi:mannonate dehydratase